jgi:hypothetical protein
VLRWAQANGCLWDWKTSRNAVSRGQLEILQWAHVNGCPWDIETCRVAAKWGYLEALQYARENGCPWDVTTCRDAAFGGKLEVLQWARGARCPWDSETCRAAAAGKGNLEILKWARANGCPWDAVKCLAATALGTMRDTEGWECTEECTYPAVALWILKNAQLGEFNLTMLRWGVRVAARQDDTKCFKMLRAYWKRGDEGPLRAGPRCARLAKDARVPLHPGSEEELRRVVERQVAAAIALDRLGLSRELLLEIFGLAGFLWVPT